MSTQTETERKPARTKNPRYDVFATAEPDGDGHTTGWVCLSENIAAGSRREAIQRATEGLTEDEQYGTFAVVKHGEFHVITRARKVEPQDVWT